MIINAIKLKGIFYMYNRFPQPNKPLFILWLLSVLSSESYSADNWAQKNDFSKSNSPVTLNQDDLDELVDNLYEDVKYGIGFSDLCVDESLKILQNSAIDHKQKDLILNVFENNIHLVEALIESETIKQFLIERKIRRDHKMLEQKEKWKVEREKLYELREAEALNKIEENAKIIMEKATTDIHRREAEEATNNRKRLAEEANLKAMEEMLNKTRQEKILREAEEEIAKIRQKAAQDIQERNKQLLEKQTERQKEGDEIRNNESISRKTKDRKVLKEAQYEVESLKTETINSLAKSTWLNICKLCQKNDVPLMEGQFSRMLNHSIYQSWIKKQGGEESLRKHLNNIKSGTQSIEQILAIIETKSIEEGQKNAEAVKQWEKDQDKIEQNKPISLTFQQFQFQKMDIANNLSYKFCNYYDQIPNFLSYRKLNEIVTQGQSDRSILSNNESLLSSGGSEWGLDQLKKVITYKDKTTIKGVILTIVGEKETGPNEKSLHVTYTLYGNDQQEIMGIDFFRLTDSFVDNKTFQDYEWVDEVSDRQTLGLSVIAVLTSDMIKGAFNKKASKEAP